MKIIFLDIDGVLNSGGARGYTAGTHGIEPELLAIFKALVKRTGAQVVLSSSWRKSESAKAQLREAGLTWIGETPNFKYIERGEEIDAWLRLHPKVTHYAIIDDDHDMLAWQPFFKTDWEVGLTYEICWRIEQHFLV
jgi:hydroxymethylpyrimidine pyrophosphatase-like HAD family hydrolase